MSLYSPDVQVDNPVTVSGGTISVDNFPASQPVIGPLTDAQLRSTPVPVSGPATDAQLRATPLPVSGPLTDAQLRATPVPVVTAPTTSNTATVSQVAMTASTNTTLLASNPNRKRAIIYTVKQPVYVKFGATASATSFTYAITTANSTLEISVWTGQIDAFSTQGQTVSVTELV